MTVLPNFFERYTASLRNLTSLYILKKGLNKKHLENLCKIYTAEGYYSKNSTVPLDIENYCLNLFCAVSVIKFKRNQKFKFNINLKENFLINQKLFTVLILTLCNDCRSIEINSENNFIQINFKGEYKKSLKALAALKGFYFYSIKTSRGKIIIPAKETAEKSIQFAGLLENIYDRFSPVNLFFQNIL